MTLSRRGSTKHGNPSRAGDTEANSASNTTTKPTARGRHQGVRRGRRRCVPALPPRHQTTSGVPSEYRGQLLRTRPPSPQPEGDTKASTADAAGVSPRSTASCHPQSPRKPLARGGHRGQLSFEHDHPAHSPRATPRRPPRTPQVCPRATAAPPNDVPSTETLLAQGTSRPSAYLLHLARNHRANPSRAGDTEAVRIPPPCHPQSPRKPLARGGHRGQLSFEHDHPAHSPRATPRRPPRTPQVCPRATAAPPNDVPSTETLLAQGTSRPSAYLLHLARNHRANPSRAGDTEANSASNTTTQPTARGRHQGVRRGRRRCVPALPPRHQTTSLRLKPFSRRGHRGRPHTFSSSPAITARTLRARGKPRPTQLRTRPPSPQPEGDTKASAPDAVGVSPRYHRATKRRL